MTDTAMVLFILLFLCVMLPVIAASRNRKKGAASPIHTATGQQSGAASGKNPETAPAPAQRIFQPALAPRVAYGSHDDSIYQGSLNAESSEGYDPCHEPELQGLNEAEAPILQESDSVPSLPFGWTGSDMVKGIVISEVLKRRTR